MAFGIEKEETSQNGLAMMAIFLNLRLICIGRHLGKKEKVFPILIRAVMLATPEHYGTVNDNTVETMRQNYHKIQRRIFGTESKRKGHCLCKQTQA